MKKRIFDGVFLRELRIANGYTLEEVANAIGTSKGYMWELEEGGTKNPSFEKVALLAYVLDVKMESFIAPLCSLDYKACQGRMLKRKLPTVRTMKIMRDARAK